MHFPESEALSPAAAWRARLALEYARRGARTVLVRRAHEGPLVVQKPLYPDGPSRCETILLHPPGGIAGGDALSIEVSLQCGSEVSLTTPGATKWYRSAGALAVQRVTLRAAAAAHLEWLPREQILFEGARAESTLEIELAAGATCLGWDVIALGRQARGETLRTARLHTGTRLRVDGVTRWLERGRFAGEDARLASPVALGGASVCATLWFAGAPVEPALLARCRQLVPREAAARSALTQLPGVLLARYLGERAESALDWFAALRETLHLALRGVTASRPRIWAA